MTHPKLGANNGQPAPGDHLGLAQEEMRADGLEGYEESIADALDDESDFDVDEDIAFLGEDYDVLELDDVLDMCNVERRPSFSN